MNGKRPKHAGSGGMSEALLLRRRVLRFLKREVLAVVATCGHDLAPRASLVAFAIDDDFRLWFATRRQTRKFDDLKDNARIGIVVGHEYGSWTVQLSGKAKLCGETAVKAFFENGHTTGSASRARLRGLLSGAGYPAMPFAAMPGIDVALFRVDISEVQAMDLDPDSGKARFRRFKP